MNGLQQAVFWSGSWFSNSIVGHQIDIVGIAVVPDETELPRMIDSNAVLPGSCGRYRG
jgi:hypothetical protein